jgi:hypothetical protein
MQMANEPQSPTTPESGPGTSIEKFKTPEDRDKAYLELESFSRDQARRLAELEKKLDTFDQAPAPQADPNEGKSFTDLYPSRQQADARETELASRLLTKPTEVLREHAEYIRRQTMQEVQGMVANMDAINRFKQSNPDLAKHEEIVALFVRKQPENLSPTERLKRAAPEARRYLADIAKSNINPTQPSLDPATYVEAPTSRPSSPTSPVTPEPSEEDELTEMIRERSAIQAKKRL